MFLLNPVSEKVSTVDQEAICAIEGNIDGLVDGEKGDIIEPWGVVSLYIQCNKVRDSKPMLVGGGLICHSNPRGR